MIAQENNDGFVRLILNQKAINDRYVPLGLISADKGYFSVLFKGYDNKLDKEVAIKFFDPSKRTENNEYRLRCFHRESELLEKFRGKSNIIQLVNGVSNFEIVLKDINSDIEIKNSYEFIVLELAHSDFEEYIYESTDDALNRLYCFRELCKAVFRIHKEGICHRDLKPSNFLICKNGEIKLSDLGTAVILYDGHPMSLEYTGPVGDLGYAAPELFCEIGIRDSKAFAADIFSLGTILFEMFTKTPLTKKIYDVNFLTSLFDLKRHLAVVPKINRLVLFNESIDTLVSAHRLPDIFSYNESIPNCIRNNINKLYKDLSHLNYQKRNVDPESIFRQINICVILLKNEKKEQIRRNQKRQMREKIIC